MCWCCWRVHPDLHNGVDVGPRRSDGQQLVKLSEAEDCCSGGRWNGQVEYRTLA